MFRVPTSAFRVGEELLQEHHLTVSRTARYFTLGDLSRGVEEVWFACHGYAQLAGRFLEKLRVLERSEERRVGKSVDLGGRRIIKKKNNKTRMQSSSE